MERNFFGSEHGKNEADGETGVVSQAVRNAVASGNQRRGRHTLKLKKFMRVC